MYLLIFERVQNSGLFPVTTMLVEVCLCHELQDVADCYQSVHSDLDIWPSRPCHKFESRNPCTFIVPSALIVVVLLITDSITDSQQSTNVSELNALSKNCGYMNG